MMRFLLWLIGCQSCDEGGCRHDWEVLASEGEYNLQHRVDSDIACEHLPILCVDYQREYYRRVCLACGAVDDQIAEAEQKYRQQLGEQAKRHQKAKQLFEAGK